MKPIKEALKKLPVRPVNGNGHASPPDAIAVADAVKAAIEATREEPNPFPLEAFPKRIQAIVRHWHSVYRRPIDFHGGSIIAAASGAIGNAFQIEHVVGDVEPLSAWVVIVGPPSSAKSPIMRTCLKPLFANEKLYSSEHKKAVEEWEANKLLAANAGAKRQVKEEPRPRREQRIVSDATIEALIKILLTPNCWRGVIAFKDEFIGLMKGMNAYKSSGQDLEHFLSMWSGTPVMLNRSSLEDAGFVESPFIAILGSIQPGILSSLTDGGKIANGFLYRLLFCYPENVQIPKPSGEMPRQEIYDEYAEIIQNLNNLPTSPDRLPTVLRMTTEAFRLYEEYKIRTEQEIINKTDDENIQSLYGKIISYTLRLAGILDLLEFVSTADRDFLRLLSHADISKHQVSATSIKRAILLSDYFTRNSLKILTRTEDPTAALPPKQYHLYEKLPIHCTSAFAIEVAEKLGVSAKTARRLIRRKDLFAQNKDGSYRKLYT